MQADNAAYTRKHSGWPFTEENLIGEFIELPRVEHERLLAEIDRLREALLYISEYPNRTHIYMDNDGVELAEYAREALVEYEVRDAS